MQQPHVCVFFLTALFQYRPLKTGSTLSTLRDTTSCALKKKISMEKGRFLLEMYPAGPTFHCTGVFQLSGGCGGHPLPCASAQPWEATGTAFSYGTQSWERCPHPLPPRLEPPQIDPSWMKAEGD